MGNALLSCWCVVCLQTCLSCSRELRLFSGGPEHRRHDADPECLCVPLKPEVSGGKSSFSPALHTVLLHILVRSGLETADDSEYAVYHGKYFTSMAVYLPARCGGGACHPHPVWTELLCLCLFICLYLYLFNPRGQVALFRNLSTGRRIQGWGLRGA